MAVLLELRDRVLAVYAQFELYIDRAFRFLVVLLCLLCINGLIGYQETLTGLLPTLLISLVCVLLPCNGTVIVLAAVITVHLYALSIETALVGACLLLVLMLLYLRFSPRDTMLLLLYPACSAAGISYALPVAGGLLYGPTSGLTVAVGVIVRQYLQFVHSNETVFATAGTDTEDMIARFQYLIDGILSDRGMMIRAVSVIVGAAVVYVIRKLSVPYAWIIASGAGALTQLIILLIGTLAYDTELTIATAFLGVAAAFLIGVAISFFMFNLDYARVENTQFEDDDYYYYVKAVPKNLYARPRRTVKTINSYRTAPLSLRGHRGERQQPPEEETGAWDGSYDEEEPVYEEAPEEDAGGYTGYNEFQNPYEGDAGYGNPDMEYQDDGWQGDIN